MSPSQGPAKPYHHGDLAAAAIAEGLRVLAEEPHGDLSLRAIARATGVAHRALYRHFADRAAFEAALAAQGFVQLGGALRGLTQPVDFVCAYARFALAHPALYDLMMRQTYQAFEGHSALREAADDVIAASLHALAPQAPSGEEGRRAVMRLWMLAHGGLGLHRSGVLRARSDEDFVAELLRIAGLSQPQAEGPQPLWPQSTPGETT